jgi:hypothetical protein
MKTCIECKIEQEDECFSLRANRTDRRLTCKSCTNNVQRLFRQKNNKQILVKLKEKRIKVKEYIHKIKQEKGCIICKETEPVCLDFHHLDPNEKEFDLGNGNQSSIKKIDNEIVKCVVLCANCHRKLHAGLLQLSKKQLE